MDHPKLLAANILAVSISIVHDGVRLALNLPVSGGTGERVRVIQKIRKLEYVLTKSISLPVPDPTLLLPVMILAPLKEMLGLSRAEKFSCHPSPLHNNDGLYRLLAEG